MPYGLLGRPTPVPMPAVDYALDVNAADYIRRVEAADGQALELPARLALDTFIRGCKVDGIWNAIKASCILAGARTLSGALVPLVGTAPTNFNFVAADYNRKTGLVGDGSAKYLDSNRNNNTDEQNNAHHSVYASVPPSNLSARAYIGAGAAGMGSTQINSATASPFLVEFRSRTATLANVGTAAATGLIGHSRSSAAVYSARISGASYAQIQASETPHNGNVLIFARNSSSNVAGLFNGARLSFYSIGEALDLALLDARVTQLMNALAVAL